MEETAPTGPMSASPGPLPGPAPRRAASRLRTAGVLALCLAAGFLLFEGALRFLLFTELGAVRERTWRLRREGEYSPVGSRESWKLRALFSGERADRVHPRFDPRTGWLKGGIDPETLAHPDEATLGARRPVLFFGDSYAACLTSSETCWQGLLERSEHGQRLALLNYGMGGYGTDQILLLMRHVLGRFAEHDPLVIVGILVDDDLDRSCLELREFPKPRFSLEGGRLVLHPVEQRTASEFIEAHPLAIRSYAWRWLLFGSGLCPPVLVERLHVTDERDALPFKQALNTAILGAMQEELETRGLSYFFVLFHGRRGLAAEGPYGWQEPLLRDFFARSGMPFVSSKRYLLAHVERTSVDPGELFFADGLGLNHYKESTNAVVFEALQDGIEGRFEPAASPR